MRLSKRAIIVLLGAILGVLVVIPAAVSTQLVERPESSLVSMWPTAASTQVVGEAEPFHLLHGWGDVSEQYPRDRYTVRLFMDGVELAPTFVGCVEDVGNPTTHCRDHLWDFDAGISEVGVYELVAMWMAPCGALAEYGQYPGPIDDLSDFAIVSCVNDAEPIVHPDLVSRKTLIVGEVSEPELTPVDWTIYVDYFDAGVHSIFTVVEAQPLFEDTIDDMYGALIWDGITEVDLCGINIRDGADDWIHIGDGFSTGEGCGDNPDAMQEAFDAYGIPDGACVGVVVYGETYEYCGPLNEEYGPFEEG